MISEEVKAKLRRLLDARQERDTAKKKAENKEKDYRELEAEVWDMLDEADLEPPYKFKLGEPYGTVRFNNRTTYYGRIIDEDAALEGFEQRAVIDEMTKPKIVMQRINEEVRDAIEQGKPLPPGVDFYPKRFVSISKEKSE
jgi:hypothetical protein